MSLAIHELPSRIDESVIETTRIELEDPYTDWYRSVGGKGESAPMVYVRGYAQFEGSELRDQDLAREIGERAQSTASEDAVEVLRGVIPILNGGWACVVVWPNGRLLAAVDRVRSIPLFWRTSGNSIIVADDPVRCVPANTPLQVDPSSALEYLLAGYVTNGETLYKGVSQIRAGELLDWNPARADEKCTTSVYYRFHPAATNHESSQAQLMEEFEAVSTNWMDTFSRGLNGERIVVPLSGGLDSRFVAAMLRRAGVEDVLCFSYGTHEDDEVTVSREVAKVLGYEWRFFRLDERAWESAYRDPCSRKYWQYGGKGVSMPHWQDFPAVCQLAEEGYQGRNTIYFPGHTGDMLSGGHLPRTYPYLDRGLVTPESAIFQRHYSLWRLGRQLSETALHEGFLEKIGMTLAASKCTGASPAWQLDCWNIMYRQALYIINSVRAYEFFNARWRTMWDYRLMDFFARLPLSDRFGRRFYLGVLRDRIFVDQLARLSKIPIAGRGRWDEIDSMSRPMSEWEFRTRQFRKRLIRSKPSWHSLLPWLPRRRAKQQSVLDCLVQLQFLHATTRTKLKQVLMDFGDVHSLPSPVSDVLGQYMNRRVCDLPWLGVFSSATLCFMLTSMAKKVPNGEETGQASRFVRSQ